MLLEETGSMGGYKIGKGLGRENSDMGISGEDLCNGEFVGSCY